MPRAKGTFALALTVCIVHAAAGQQVITQEELVQAGITRPGDLFRLAYGWTTSSTEGYAWDAAALGTAPEQEPAWLLFVNEAPIDLRALGRANLNMLPIPMAEVCEVTLYTHPTQIGGMIAPAGAIHVLTCAPPKGVTLRGIVAAGNETGDPGPYKYLQEKDTNVDRTGPAAHGTLMLKRPRGYVRITGLVDEHHSTDPLIRPRVRTLYRGEKDARIHHRAAGLDMNSSGRWGAVDAWIAATRLEDLRFFERLGLEVPVNHDVLIGHMSGSFVAPAVDFRLSAQQLRLVTRPNPQNVVVDWEQTAIRGLVQRRIGRHTTLGMRSALLRTWGLGMDRHQLLLLHNAFVHAGVEASPNVSFKSDLHASMDGGVLGWQALGSMHHRPLSLVLTLHLRRQAPAASQGYTYWSSLGYRPSGLPPDEAPLLPRTVSTQSIDLSWQTGNAVRLMINAGVRKQGNLPLSRFTLRYDSLTTGLGVAAAPVSASGTVATIGGQLEAGHGSQLALGLFGRYAYPVSSEHAFRAVWHTRTLVQLQLRFVPNSRFSIHGALRYRGASSWSDYARVASEAPDRYSAALPSAAIADLTIQKRFWRQRLRVSASLRNLLNEPYRTHPGGAASRLAFHVRVQYRLSAFSGV